MLLICTFLLRKFSCIRNFFLQGHSLTLYLWISTVSLFIVEIRFIFVRQLRKLSLEFDWLLDSQILEKMFRCFFFFFFFFFSFFLAMWSSDFWFWFVFSLFCFEAQQSDGVVVFSTIGLWEEDRNSRGECSLWSTSNCPTRGGLHNGGNFGPFYLFYFKWRGEGKWKKRK